MIDADELARLREVYAEYPYTDTSIRRHVLSLIDALEEAQVMLDAHLELEVTHDICFDKAIKDREAARALLREIREDAECGACEMDVMGRIDAELGKGQ